MNLGNVFETVLFLLGKDQYGGYVTPANIEEAINFYEQPDYFNAQVRLFENTRENSLDIFPFFKTLGDSTFPALPVTPFGLGGYAQKPADFWYFARAESYQYLNNCQGFTTKPYMLEWLDEATFGDRVTSELMYPTKKRPIATIQNNQIYVVPYVQELIFTYLRKPADVVFDYDIVNGTIVYLPPGTFHTNSSVQPTGTPSLSVELEWPESGVNEIIRRLVQYYGRSIQSPIDMTIPNKKPEP